ncbi:MAG: hypothetical protein DMF60_17940 [Acidobacteria bacterium]|nr:MAG: hypothetical protein DMF60_17940 [Acidobacteriota bacterium]
MLVLTAYQLFSSDYKGPAIPRKPQVFSFRLRNRERTAAPSKRSAAQEPPGSQTMASIPPICDFRADMKRYHC